MAKISKKLKLFTLMAVILLLSVTVVSCNSKRDNENNDGNNANNVVDEDAPLGTDGLIFNSQTPLNLIFTDAKFPEQLSNNLAWALRENLGERVNISSTENVPSIDHEIIIGRSSRSVSKRAYERLEDLMTQEGGDGFGGYVLYSDGSSLALAYTEEIGDQHLLDIMAELTEMAEKTSLVKKAGIASCKLYNMYDIYAEEDQALKDSAWASLEDELGEDVTKALKELYSSAFSSDIISWLANLYEPRECICDNYVDGVQVCLHPVDKNGNDLCKNGGFYYSNSARNTAGYLPDIESTYQALDFLEMTGMLSKYGDDFGDFIDGQLRSDIVAFTKGLQNEDGYFYHPQWTIEMSRSNWSRVSRDLMWSTAILQKFGERPYYSTPTGSMSGTGGRPQATSATLTERLETSSASAVSKVAATANTLPTHLQSVDAFKTYLSKFKLDVFGSGYAAANELAAQVDQLVAADKNLGGALKPVLFEWFEEKHNPTNGLWRTEIDYDGLNTVFKALMVYSAFKMPFTYAQQAAESAIYVLSSDEVPGHVCGTYNTWYDIAGLISNIRAYHPDAENRGAIADSIRERVIKIAPSAIRNTIKNTLIFQKSDGSFSYFADHLSETSQGMLVSPRKNEGDVNASLICTGGLIDHMGMALGVELPPIFGTRELAEFMDIINSNTYSVKDSLPPDTVARFDNETVGIESAEVKASTGSGGTCVVDVDPLNANNQVLHLKSLNKSGTWDAVTVQNNSVKLDNNCLVFTGKFMFAKQGTSQGYLVQMYIGMMGKDSPYFINFTISGDYVEVWEGSSDNYLNSFDRLLGKFKLDEWFKLRIEYYMGYEDIENGLTPHDTVRIKIYTNDQLVAVSANYMDASMKKFIDGKGNPVDEADQLLFYPMSYMECNVYFDDLYLGYKKIPYVSEKDTKGLIINEDADAERKTYDFNDDAAPEEFVISGEQFKFTDGALNLLNTAGSGTLTIPALNRKTLSNVFSLGFDIKVDSAKVGDVFTIKFKDPDKGTVIVSYTMKCVESADGLILAPIYKGTTLLNSAAIPVDGSLHHLEFAFFVDAVTTLIYKDGKMIASTEQGVIDKCYLYEMGSATIEYTGSISASLDNVYCERRVESFAEETKPEIDRVVYDFSQGSISEIEGLTTNGSLDNGTLSIAGGKYVIIPANDRSAYVSAYQFYMEMDNTKYQSDETAYVGYVDADGNAVIGIVMTVKHGVMYFYETLNNEMVGEYIAACEYDGSAALTFNLFVTEKALEVYVDGVLVLVTATFNGGEHGDVKGIKVTSQTAVIDNVYLDGITLTYTAPKVDMSTKDDTDYTITYDYSSLGNYPGKVSSSVNSTQTSSVDFVERDGEPNKVFVYKKMLENYPGGVRFTFDNGASKSKMVFETDMKLAGGLAAGGWRSSFDFYFANATGGTHMYILQFNVTGGHLYVNLNNGTQLEKIDCGAIPEDGWFNIRVELSAGDGTTNKTTGSKLKFFYNGAEVYSGNDFVGSNAENAKIPISAVTQVMLIPITQSTGTIYLDNTVIQPLD